jgi:predicted AlkP superfamily phosphohydrolase/phosphomutase
MNQSKGVLLIGLDGATWKLLKPWIADGYLPNLGRLCREGASGKLLSTVPSMTCPALPALFTGRNPANLGVLSFYNASGEPVLLDSYTDDKLWDVIGRKGGATCAIDVRFTYPPPAINGVITCSTPLPSNAKQLYYPDDLEKQLGRKIPLALDFHSRIYRSMNFDERKTEISAIMKEWVEKRYRLLIDLTSKRHYDLIFTWFSDLDCMQHLFWHEQSLILEHLKTVDQYVGKLVNDFADRNIIILSDHGFHKYPKKRVFVNTWLLQEGFLDAKGSKFSRWLYEKTVKAYRLLLRIPSIKKLIERKRTDDKSSKKERIIMRDIYRGAFPGINWKTTRAYMFCEWGVKIIRENLNEDYESYRQRLIDRMRGFTNEQGQRVFPNVWKKEEVFQGKYFSQIPDIICLFNEDYYPDPIISSGKLFGEHKIKAPYPYTGTHENDREGIFIAFGLAFAAQKDIGVARIEDIAPTIYHLLKCAMPDNLDGKIISTALSTEEALRKPEYYTPSEIITQQGAGRISKDDEESIKQQLKDMGYLSE